MQAGEPPSGEGPDQDLHGGRLTLAHRVKGAQERAEGVDLVLGAQWVLLGQGQA